MLRLQSRTIFSIITLLMFCTGNTIPVSAKITTVSNKQNSFACEDAIQYVTDDINNRLEGKVKNIEAFESSNSRYAGSVKYFV
jgi:hypothetical protein